MSVFFLLLKSFMLGMLFCFFNLLWKRSKLLTSVSCQWQHHLIDKIDKQAAPVVYVTNPAFWYWRFCKMGVWVAFTEVMSCCGQQFECNENCTSTPGCYFEKLAALFCTLPQPPNNLEKGHRVSLYFFTNFSKELKIYEFFRVLVQWQLVCLYSHS